MKNIEFILSNFVILKYKYQGPCKLKKNKNRPTLPRIINGAIFHQIFLPRDWHPI
jgi:hypothetical protein